MHQLITPAESAVLVSMMYNVYGGPDVLIPAWAHNESRKPHRLPNPKAGGAVRTLTRKGYINHDSDNIYLTDTGIAAAVTAALQEFTPELRDLAKRVIEYVQQNAGDRDAWVVTYGRKAASRAVDKLIDGDVFEYPELLYVIETQLNSWFFADPDGKEVA